MAKSHDAREKVKRRVFISSARSDRDMVRRLVRSLGDVAEFVFDEDLLLSGESFFESLKSLVQTCHASLLIVTPSFLETSSTNFVTGLLIQLVWERPDFRIIPVLLRGARSFDLPPPLSHYTGIEGSTLTDNELVEALRSALQAAAVESVHGDMRAENRPGVFLSYATEDRKFARGLAEQLARMNIPVALDDAESPRGDAWLETASAAIEKAKDVVLLISDRFLSSPWLNLAAGVALGKQARSRATRVVPVLLSGVEWSEVPALLRRSHSIDASGLDMKALAERIAPVLGGDEPSQTGSAAGRTRSGSARKKAGS